ncbi:Histone H2AX [Toxocara canis]|uniref:Histone H2A n=1 Tax=Toxocara canis TaxID=6265 RepID=A0A0B2UI29_TOXCA|nr:Histone H2AX [Toxocara canis]
MAVLDDLLAKKEDNAKTVMKTVKSYSIHLDGYARLSFASTQGNSTTSSSSKKRGGGNRPPHESVRVDGFKQKRVSKSARAGLQFPVTKFHRLMKEAHRAKRVTQSAAVYLSAVVEYLSAEILELSGNACRDNKRKRLVPRHILLAVKNDEELDRMCSKVTIRQGGVLPFVHPVLFAKGGNAVPLRPVRRLSESQSQA